MTTQFDVALKEQLQDEIKADNPEAPEPYIPLEMSDGRVIKIYQPTEGQIGVLMSALGKGSAEVLVIGGLVQFFCDLLEPEDRYYIETRLMNRKDELSKNGVTIVQGWVEELIEAWAGNPTKSFSVFTPSPESTGTSSTPPTPESTSSPSLFTDS